MRQTYAGTHLARVLFERGLTKTWLAQETGYNRWYVIELLSRNPTPRRPRRYSPTFVERACRALDLPEEALFFDPLPSDQKDSSLIEVTGGAPGARRRTDAA